MTNDKKCDCKVSVHSTPDHFATGIDYCALHGAARDMRNAIAHVLTTLAMGLQPGGTDKRMLANALAASGYSGGLEKATATRPSSWCEHDSTMRCSKCV